MRSDSGVGGGLRRRKKEETAAGGGEEGRNRVAGGEERRKKEETAAGGGEEGRNVVWKKEETRRSWVEEKRKKEETAAGGGEEGRDVPHFFAAPPLRARFLAAHDQSDGSTRPPYDLYVALRRGCCLAGVKHSSCCLRGGWGEGIQVGK